MVHIFKGDDGVADAFIYLVLINPLPFFGKFRLIRQKGHEIVSEGVGTVVCFGAHQTGKGNVDHAQADGSGNFRIGQNLVQNREIGIFSMYKGVLVAFASQPLGR